MTTNAVVPIREERPNLTAGGRPMAIVPQNMDEAWRLGKAIVMSGMAPAAMDTPEKCMIAIMRGMEVGLTPMQALDKIAVINGRPTIWGDGAMALVRGSGVCEYVEESVEGEGDKRTATCKAKRRGEPNPIMRTFSVADAKTANLWGKSGPWKQFPDRMLQMRSRAFTLRDLFADVLGGLYLREEIEDDTPRGSERPSGPPPAPKQIDPPPAPVIETDARPAPPTAPPAPEPEEEFDAGARMQEIRDLLAGALDVSVVDDIVAWFSDDLDLFNRNQREDLEVLVEEATKRLEGGRGSPSAPEAVSEPVVAKPPPAPVPEAPAAPEGATPLWDAPPPKDPVAYIQHFDALLTFVVDGDASARMKAFWGRTMALRKEVGLAAGDPRREEMLVALKTVLAKFPPTEPKE